MRYLIPISRISIGTVQKIFEFGYDINFNFNTYLPYLEIFVPEEKEKEFKTLVK